MYEQMVRSFAAHALSVELRTISADAPMLRERMEQLEAELDGFQPNTRVVCEGDSDTAIMAKVIFTNVISPMRLNSLAAEMEAINEFFKAARELVLDLIEQHELPRDFLTLKFIGEKRFYSALGVAI